MKYSLSLLALLGAAAAEQCLMIGYLGNSRSPLSCRIGCAGDTFGGYKLYYKNGGKEIAVKEDGQPANPKGDTIPANSMKLPNEFKYSVAGKGGAIFLPDCKGTYDGKEYKSVKTDIKPCKGGVDGINANICNYCAVEFECPSGL